MKKLLLSVTLLACVCLFTNAQLPVSTAPENKNVVLEEFTGVNCYYCPDGHKLAQQLADDNPGDVVLINIHVGNFAVPGTGDLDLRTPFGTDIKDQSSLTGYPAGTINRHDFTTSGWDMNGGTAMSRSYWDDAGAVLFGQSSYVNIAGEASIDYTTRVLTVNVEAYYTANGAASNNINVALLQNNVEGTQTGAEDWNPGNILPNGNYNHQHALRHLLTGQWGDVTTATTSGTTYTNTFTYTIPAAMAGVAYDIFNLEVVLFVAEGQQEIISGSIASMNYVLPPGLTLVDLAASTNMTMPADYCDPNVTPEVTVMNNSTVTVDTFEVYYVLDGGTPVTMVGNNLAASTSATFTFPALVLASGTHTLAYNVNTDNAVNIIDNVSGNNNAASADIITISPTAFATSHTEGFESYSNGDDVVNNVVLVNADAENTFVVSNAISGGSVTWNLGAYGNSDNSWRMRFRSWAVGSVATLLFENIDLSGSTGNGLRLSYAHALDNGTELDKFEINVSKDCGVTWTNVFREGGGNLSTAAAPVPSNWFYPAVTEWDSANIDLGAFDGESAVMIEFKGTSGGGNNLYFDDIQISNTVDLSNPYVYSGITESEKALFEAVELFPNPASNFTFVRLEMSESADVKVEVRNMLGQMVKVVSDGVLNVGIHRLSINTVDFNEGLYYLNIYSEEGNITKKFVVTK